MSAIWLGGVVAMLLPVAVALLGLLRGTKADRLAAVQITSAFATIVLAMMSYAFDQAAALDVAFTLVLLALPGSLLYALFEERWL